MILIVENLTKKFGTIKAVDKVSFSIKKGEFFAVIGESGSGKTTLGKTIIRLLEPDEGKIIFDGKDITKGKVGKELRRRMQIIFQNPFSSLNPKMRVWELIYEGILVHKLGNGERVKEILKIVGIPEEYMWKYPGELSGGQRQRVAIGRAIIVNPEFLVADEPTSSLDVSIRAQIMQLLEYLRKKFNLTIFFITHDIKTVEEYADTIAVMYLGKIFEIGKKEEILKNPKHPYTKLLLKSVIDIKRLMEEGRYNLEKIEGEIPPHNIKGCKFRTRCPLAEKLCEEEPELKDINGTKVACHFVKS